MLDLPKAIEERLAEGRAERESVPLEAHGEWAAPDDRPDPVGILEVQNATRVAELVPIRHGRMIVSPFTFYRGSAAIMAWDMSCTPTAGLRVQCCGDAHLSNFGVFAAPDRRVVFDLNDFDETLPAPFEWDVKRLVASFVVAARSNGDHRKEQRAAARTVAAAYRRTMAKAATMRFLDVWYARADALLRVMMRRELDVGTVSAPDGQTRVLLRLPTWEDYVGVALDETIAMKDASLQVRRRVERLLTELVAIAPPGRRESLQARIERA